MAVDAAHAGLVARVRERRGFVDEVAVTHRALPVRVLAFRRVPGQVACQGGVRVMTAHAAHRALLVAIGQQVPGELVGREELGAVGPQRRIREGGPVGGAVAVLLELEG